MNRTYLAKLGDEELDGGLALETLGRVDDLVGREGVKGGDGGGGGPDPAPPLHHLVHGGGCAGEHGLDGAVAAVPDPAAEAELSRVLHCPVAEEHALDPPLDHHAHLVKPKPLESW